MVNASAAAGFTVCQRHGETRLLSRLDQWKIYVLLQSRLEMLAHLREAHLPALPGPVKWQISKFNFKFCKKDQKENTPLT